MMEKDWADAEEMAILLCPEEQVTISCNGNIIFTEVKSCINSKYTEFCWVCLGVSLQKTFHKWKKLLTVLITY